MGERDTVSDVAVACVEVGGGSCQTVVFGPTGQVTYFDGARSPAGLPLLVATPGLIADGQVQYASNLGWSNVDPAVALGLTEPVALLANDAEAAALGETVMRGADAADGLVFVSLGTGVGGAVVRAGRVVGANLFGHTGGFGTRVCPCGQVGCLETVASGWALPPALGGKQLRAVGSAVAAAIELEPLARSGLVVIGGGIARRYPLVVSAVADALPGRNVAGSIAPAAAKSMAAWGLRHLFRTAAALEQSAATA